MTFEKRIDRESYKPLKNLKKLYPKGLNGISDIVKRRECFEKVQK